MSTVSAKVPSRILLREIEPDTPEYAEAREVRYEALYREWELPWSLVDDMDGRIFRHIAAFDSAGRVVGYGRLWLEGGESKIFQVSVAPSRRGEGIGAALVEELVRIARDAGRSDVVLDARQHVVAYYERLGFVAEGEEFISARTGTPHCFMRRVVAGP